MLLFISFLSGTLLFHIFGYFPVSAVILFIVFSVCAIFKRKAAFIPVLLIGVAYAFVRFFPGDSNPDVWNKELFVKGRFVPRVSHVPPAHEFKRFVIDEALEPETDESVGALRGEKLTLLSDYDVHYDYTYELLILTGKDRRRMNPGAYKKAALYGDVKEIISSYPSKRTPEHIFNRYRYALNTYLLNTLNPDSAGLVSAITTGERSLLSDGMKNAFNRTGLAHLLSISGTHFGLFSVMLFGVFTFLIKRLPYRYLQRLTLYLTPQQASAILCTPFMLMYLGLSGGSLPAVRSFVMVSFFLAGLLIGRKGFWLNSLLFAAVVLVLWDPEVMLSLSFQLSFTAVLFIGFTLTSKEDDDVGEREESNRFIRYGKNVILLTLSAAIGTAPLVAYHFHYGSIIAPLSNLLVAPIVGFILIPLSLLSSFAFMLTGQYVFSPLVEASADLSITLVKLLSLIPYADTGIPSFPVILLLFFYGGFLIFLLLGRKKRLLLVPFLPFAVFLIFHMFENKEMSVTYLDVGQGDSAVVELPDGRTLLVDTGRTGKEAGAFLAYTGKKDIDALVISHIHPDHAGGLEYIMKGFHLKELWDNGMIAYYDSFSDMLHHRTLERGDTFRGDSYEITVLHPYEEFYTLFGSEYAEENDRSLVMKLSGSRSSFLFTGDIGEAAETNMAHLKEWLSSDVVKIPHHGSRTSAHEAFLSGISPSYAVISVGRENDFGHPSQEVLDQLDGVEIVRTDRDGAIKIIETENGLEVKTYRTFVLQKAVSFQREWRNIKNLFSTW